MLDHNTSFISAPQDFVTDMEELAELLALPHTVFDAASLKKVQSALPLKIPRSLLNRIEKGNPTDPILLQFLPQNQELELKEGFSKDPLKEWNQTNHFGVMQKYQHRALILTTNTCGAHCRFCFRRHFPKNRALFPESSPTQINIASQVQEPNGALAQKTDQKKEIGSELFSNTCKDTSSLSVISSKNLLNLTEHFDEFFRSLRENPSISEIILSGGDPLAVSNDFLKNLLYYIKSIPHVNRVRIHTRYPILCPRRIDAALRELFAEIAEKPACYFVLHINHPNEIDDEVAETLRQLHRCGVELLSQTVLLRGVNDDAGTLATLFEKLIDLHVLPYYLHQLDRVQGAAAFEVPVERGLELMEQLKRALPGYAVPRYVREESGVPYKKNLEAPKEDVL